MGRGPLHLDAPSAREDLTAPEAAPTLQVAMVARDVPIRDGHQQLAARKPMRRMAAMAIAALQALVRQRQPNFGYPLDHRW